MVTFKCHKGLKLLLSVEKNDVLTQSTVETGGAGLFRNTWRPAFPLDRYRIAPQRPANPPVLSQPRSYERNRHHHVSLLPVRDPSALSVCDSAFPKSQGGH